MAIVSCLPGSNRQNLKQHVREIAAVVNPKRTGIRCAGLMVADLKDNELTEERREITEDFYDIKLLIRRDLRDLVTKVCNALDEL